MKKAKDVPQSLPPPPRFAKRTSGILLHPTSLPGGHGVGDLGPGARWFAERIAAAGQTHWQMLPVCPVGTGFSPYDSPSAAALNPLLVSVDDLASCGLIERDQIDYQASPGLARYVDFERASRFKEHALRIAHARLATGAPATIRSEYREFCEEQSNWLQDHALFFALKEAQNGAPWVSWPAELRDRKPAALARASRQLDEQVDFHRFVQYVLDRQWTQLRERCAELHLSLMGDLPIYVAHDSVDVWAHRQNFFLDRRGNREVVAGVPPDYFSNTGQLWGNPLYRWRHLSTTGFGWWLGRFRVNLRRFDTVRLDHFIGFRRYWEVPGTAKTAEHGRYRSVPGQRLFETVQSQFGSLPFVAEDLGTLTPEIHELRNRIGLPGMRILLFAFDDPNGSDYLPHRYAPNTVVYTGTHDNDTVTGWFHAPAPEGIESAQWHREIRERALRYVGTDGRQIHRDLLRLALASVANTAIFPVQDLLGLGSDCRMNRPGTTENNWAFRLLDGELDDDSLMWLRELCSIFDRIPPPPPRTVP